jgi:hypothetical protein
MTGLLDHIFHNLEERKLDRSQIADYFGIRMNLYSVAYHWIKSWPTRRLVKRLNALNRDQIKFYPGNKEDNES